MNFGLVVILKSDTSAIIYSKTVNIKIASIIMILILILFYFSQIYVG